MKTCAVNNENQYVRSTAIEQLGQQFKEDPDTVKILQSRAVDDEKYNVRITAIKLLKEELRNDADVQEFLDDL
ncbi:MAG TPA: hypothetical protein DCF68_11980 [Cyanothece sp. UBA12306]|nr:hypothetical protein [Cyanothece sp. UBA12306]